MNIDILGFDEMKGQPTHDMYKTFTQAWVKKKNPRKTNYVPNSKDSVVNLDFSHS